MSTLVDDAQQAGEMPDNAARIMDAGIELFGRKGYSATSVREIVQKARVTNPMLYYYFGSKDGLFRQTIEHLLEHRHTMMREALGDKSSDFLQKLRNVVDFHMDSLCERPEILTFFYAIAFGPRESRPEFPLHESSEAVHRMVAEFFDEAIEAENLEPADSSWDSLALAEAFMGQLSFHMMRTMKLVEPLDERQREHALDQMTNDEARDRLIQFFLKGAGTLRTK